MKICIYLYLFHDWFLLEHGTCLEFVFIFNISLMYKYLLEWIMELWVNQKKIKTSRKKYVMSTCFKFWPMESIFRKLFANKSLVMTCLQIYREQLSLATFLRVHSNSKKVSYLLDKINILTLKLLVISNQDFPCELNPPTPCQISHICRCDFNVKYQFYWRNCSWIQKNHNSFRL